MLTFRDPFVEILLTQSFVDTSVTIEISFRDQFSNTVIKLYIALYSYIPFVKNDMTQSGEKQDKTSLCSVWLIQNVQNENINEWVLFEDLPTI